MINLNNDYCGLAHPKIMEKLNNNLNNTYNGYGLDEVTNEAKNKIKKRFNAPKADVHFLCGGTLTNKIMIAHSLKPYEAIISASSGHINTHETGAIEANGHKIITIKENFGKINPNDIEKICTLHHDEHMVKPKLVYISNPTEYGTIYTKEELKNLFKICQKEDLYLYLDGARLACALTARNNDIKIEDYAKYTDAFYLGGQKDGLLFGEALVVINPKLQTDLRYTIKQYGGLYAKGFVLGLQFLAFLENDLFLENGLYQNNLMKTLVNGLIKLEPKIKIKYPPETNQLFLEIPNHLLKPLEKNLIFTIWEQNENHTLIRLITSLWLKETDIKEVIKIFQNAFI